MAPPCPVGPQFHHKINIELMTKLNQLKAFEASKIFRFIAIIVMNIHKLFKRPTLRDIQNRNESLQYHLLYVNDRVAKAINGNEMSEELKTALEMIMLENMDVKRKLNSKYLYQRIVKAEMKGSVPTDTNPKNKKKETLNIGGAIHTVFRPSNTGPVGVQESGHYRD